MTYTVPFVSVCPHCRKLVPQNEAKAYDSCEDCWVDRHPWMPSTNGILWNRRDGNGESYNVPMSRAALPQHSNNRSHSRKPKTQVAFYNERTNFDFETFQPEPELPGPAEQAD